MKSSGWLGLAALVVTGVILADVLIHPTGAQVAYTGASVLMRKTYSGLLGGAPVGY